MKAEPAGMSVREMRADLADVINAASTYLCVELRPELCERFPEAEPYPRGTPRGLSMGA